MLKIAQTGLPKNVGSVSANPVDPGGLVNIDHQEFLLKLIQSDDVFLWYIG